jgi:prolyl-tRNA editing enzyme YbaK/EbsC (Cys-tRNA(Pro) deacylase)
MTEPISPRERARLALEPLGLAGGIVEFAESTRTAAEAAAAVGCEPGQIVKSLFFMAEGRPTLVLVAGDRQADTAKLAQLLGVGRKKLKMGTPVEVAEITGYEVGGVAPVGSKSPCDVVGDASLQRFATVWAAAGSGHAVFPAETNALMQAAGAQWADITREPGG